MRLDQKLNLVIPVDTETRGEVWVHSTPIGRDVFKKYYLVLSKTYAQIFGQGLADVAGPRVANFVLEDIARSTPRVPGRDWWDGPDGVARGLMSEIRRLTNVVCVGERGGWEAIPYEYAIAQKIFSDEETDQLEGLIVFFIAISALMEPTGKAEMMNGIKFLWVAQTTSLNCTEYAASLPTSTAAATTRETAPPPPSQAAPPPDVPTQPQPAPLGVPISAAGTWSPPS